MAEEVKTEAKTPEVMLREIETNVEKRVEEKIESSLVEKIDAKFRAALAEFAKPRIEVVSTPETELRAMADAMLQKRTLELSGAGAYNVLAEIFKVVDLKYDLLARCRKVYGAGAQTNIPVLSARPAKPTKQAESAFGIASDGTAAQSVTTITPYAYWSEIPVSAEASIQGAANLAAELPGIFAESFAAAMMFGMLDGTGDGTMTTLFANASLTKDINCDAAGAPTWADFIELAGTTKGYAHNPVIITNPAFTGNLLASTGAETGGLKAQLMIGTPQIRGVEVIETGYAPATNFAGDVVAVALDLQNYVFAIAREMSITPVRAQGTAMTYYQAVNFMNAKPVLAANGWQLKAV